MTDRLTPVMPEPLNTMFLDWERTARCQPAGTAKPPPSPVLAWIQKNQDADRQLLIDLYTGTYAGRKTA